MVAQQQTGTIDRGNLTSARRATLSGITIMKSSTAMRVADTKDDVVAEVVWVENAIVFRMGANLSE
jgi:hypothetical protein